MRHDTPTGQVLGGFALGILPGTLFGSALPWWISGMPCYCLTGALWVWGLRGPISTGFLCGSLAGAAAMGLGHQTAPWVVLLALPFGLKSSWSGSRGADVFGMGLSLYMATVISAAL